MPLPALHRPTFPHRDTEELELQPKNPFRSPAQSLLPEAQEAVVQVHQEKGHTVRSAPLKGWFWELSSWLASLVFLLAVVVVLWKFNGRPQPDWPYGLTINAAISLLGNFAEGLMMLCVASAVGQLKWTRAHASRPLDDFRALDEASRGAYGSLLLLLRLRGGILASIGAVLSILVLAFGLFIQQAPKVVTDYPAQLMSNVSIPLASILDGRGTFPLLQGDGNVQSTGLDEGLQQAAYRGVYSPPGTMFSVSANCPTGNCSWEPYQTLAICNTCSNLTDSIVQRQVRATNPNVGEDFTFFNYTLDANGFGLGKIWTPEGGSYLPVVEVNATVHTQNAFSALEGFPLVSSIAFPNNGSVILGVIAMGLSPGTIPTQTDELAAIPGYPMAPPVAFECLLQFCVKTYTASFTGATLNETLLDTSIDNTKKILNLTKPYFTWPAASVATAGPASFSVTKDSFNGLSSYLAPFLSGTGFFGGLVPEANDTPSWLYSPEQLQILPIIQAMNQSSDGFPKLMDNLAASMSLAMRVLPYQPYKAEGKIITTEVIIQVRFGWLAFPFALLFATLVLLVFVMWESSRVRMAAWKSSILAVMLHGVNPIPAHAENLEHAKNMEGFARKSIVHFEKQDIGGSRLVLS